MKADICGARVRPPRNCADHRRGLRRRAILLAGAVLAIILFDAGCAARGARPETVAQQSRATKLPPDALWVESLDLADLASVSRLPLYVALQLHAQHLYLIRLKQGAEGFIVNILAGGDLEVLEFDFLCNPFDGPGPVNLCESLFSRLP